jgi:hypothetical protein
MSNIVMTDITKIINTIMIEIMLSTMTDLSMIIVGTKNWSI